MFCGAPPWLLLNDCTRGVACYFYLVVQLQGTCMGGGLMMNEAACRETREGQYPPPASRSGVAMHSLHQKLGAAVCIRSNVR